MLGRDEAVFGAMRAGARGCLPRGADRREIGRAVETVAHGEVMVSADMAARVLAWFASGGDRPLTPLPELTDREREILGLTSLGLSNPAIAERLFLSDEAVRDHVCSVFMKLQVVDRSDAVARARDAGTGRAEA
jgi:DNA-binding NarL/FixJ family response regulator